MTKPVINIADIELAPLPAALAPSGPAAERFDAKMGFIGPRVGARKLGYNITAVPPGKRAFPFHNHRANEEMRYLAVSTKLSPELVDYPDSGKFGMLAELPPGPDGKPQRFVFVGRESDSRNYWEGE